MLVQTELTRDEAAQILQEAGFTVRLSNSILERPELYGFYISLHPHEGLPRFANKAARKILWNRQLLPENRSTNR